MITRLKLHDAVVANTLGAASQDVDYITVKGGDIYTAARLKI